ncbi:MAG: hypothetical protein P8Y71_16510 [Pseudolabrys sp.]
MKAKLFCAAAVIVFVFGSQAEASMITYSLTDDLLTIDQGYGTGSVTGAITTDGTIGTLTAGNIVSWDITAEFGSYSHTFTNGNSGIIFTNSLGLSATSSKLSFDFTPSNLFGVTAGAGTGFLVNWQSGCNGSLCQRGWVKEYVLSSPA